MSLESEKVTVTVRDAEVTVRIYYEHTPGYISGPPEYCYPEENDFVSMEPIYIEIGDWYLEEGHDIYDWFVDQFEKEIINAVNDNNSL